MTRDAPALDATALTDKQQHTWSSGDFHKIGLNTIPLSDQLCARVDPHPGQQVLDVACGSGNFALLAARRHCEVTGLDFVPGLIERAKARAGAEGLDADFRVGDAQALPFPDASFDVVASVLGVMFAPDQRRAAAELLRVCRPGGVIALASWMPGHLGGDFFAAHARHAPPPPGLPPATRWGTEDGLAELLGAGVRSVHHERPAVDVFFARSVDHALDIYRRWFGPTIRAFEAVGPQGAEALSRDLAEVVRRYNRATDGTVILRGEYLQTVAIRA